MKKIINSAYYDLFTKWQLSGKSKASFAKDEGISGATFYYWCNKYSKKESSPPVQSSFSVITPDIGFHREPVIRVSYPSGVFIDFFEKVGIESIKELL
jgi:hypothetical protein